MDKEQQDTKKIAFGKKKNNIILNPPEKPPLKNVNERFKDVLPKHVVVIEKKIELVLQAKANTTEFPEEALKQVFVRGYKSLPLDSHLTREQYAMNRVNSFIAGGQAMIEDCDLLPIEEKFRRIGMKGTGGAGRPHIKREKNVYNGKTTYHVVDAKGVVKHSTSDEGEAKQHLAQKYNSYLGEAKKMKGEDPCWTGYHMVGKKNKAGREVPNCVPSNEEVEPIAELSKQTLTDYMARAKKGQLRTMRSILAGSQSKNVAREYDNRTTGIIKARARINKEDFVAEATSAAVRMQRALDKIKADRERKERLAAPYVNSVFAKKVEDKKKDVKEGLADDILAVAKAKGINAKIAPPLADRKKATMKLLKHRAREAKRNPPPPREAPERKTGFRSGAIDDTYGT